MSISVVGGAREFYLQLFDLCTARTLRAAEFTWIDIGGVLKVPLGLTLDQFSKTMLVMVSGVGALIHIYSLGYMRDDEGKSRYFAALSLFMFAMLGIVLANNFVMLFIFWELVGFTSYVLIGHWFDRDAAADAAKKAFITTRIGDFGFMLGILMVWMATGSIVFAEIVPRMSKMTSQPGVSDRRRAFDFLRRSWQIGAVSAARLVAGRDGRSDAGFGVDPRRDDGRGGRLHAGAGRVRHSSVARRAYGDCLDRNDHRGHGRVDRDAAGRHQAHPRLLHALATRLHGDGGRSRLERSGHVSPVHSRVFQSAALPRRRLDHRRCSITSKTSGRWAGSREIFQSHSVTFAVGALALIGCPPFSGFFSKDAILALAYEHNMPIFVVALVHRVPDGVLRHAFARRSFSSANHAANARAQARNRRLS